MLLKMIASKKKPPMDTTKKEKKRQPWVHGNQTEITAICFDLEEKYLISGSNKGVVLFSFINDERWLNETPHLRLELPCEPGVGAAITNLVVIDYMMKEKKDDKVFEKQTLGLSIVSQAKTNKTEADDGIDKRRQ